MTKKKLLVSILLVLCACLMSVTFTSCNKKPAQGETETQESELQESGITFKTLSVDGTEVTANNSFSNDTTEFSFADEIETHGNTTYQVSADKFGSQVYLAKIVPLEEGDNVYYLFVTEKGERTTFTVTLRRRHIYTVSFNTKGGASIQSQTVEEDSLASIPEATPARIGYEFAGWDYDFTTPITDNTEITAKFEVNAEMSNFEFTSTATTCTITGIKDKTVTEIIIPDCVTSIGSSVFYDNNGLTSVVIGNGVTSIDDYTFYKCSSLTSIVIGNNVTSISAYAFLGCYKLVEVINKSSYITVKKGEYFEGYIGYHALSVFNSGDTYVSKFTNDNDYIVYTDGDQKILVGYKGNQTDLVIPDYITEINPYAFLDCSNLTSVEIPDSVTSIGNYAFYGCDSLTDITFEETSTWYATDDYECWKIKVAGTKKDVTDSSTNGTNFTSTDASFYWYKL